MSCLKGRTLVMRIRRFGAFAVQHFTALQLSDACGFGIPAQACRRPSFLRRALATCKRDHDSD
jgi:hypothetical protein